MANKFRTILIGFFIVVLAAALVFLLRGQLPKPAPESGSVAVGGPPATPRRGGELVAGIRQDPPTFNRYAPRGNDTTNEVIAQLLFAQLARVNRVTTELEPWLAERWTESADHLTYTLTLRNGLQWSDGEPFTSDDVRFSFAAVYDARLNSPLKGAMLVAGQPITVAAPDAKTVVLKFPAPFGPGLRILDNLPIFPRHKLQRSLDAGSMGEAWDLASNVADVVGMGPFTLVSYAPADRIVFQRNPHYFREGLPYLDRLTLAIVRDQNTEILRIENGQIDISAREIRPEDYAPLRREADQGRVKLAEAGVGLDPNMLWFNLSPAAYKGDPRKAWLQSEDFRKAISHAVDRQAVLDQVYLGLGVPVYGPVTPGNKAWYVEDTPRYEYDPARARAILVGRLSFVDNDKDGMLEDRSGRPVRFSILTQQQDTTRMRTASVIQAQLKQAGIAVDIVGLDSGSLVQRFYAGNFDAIYFGVEATSTDPANNLDLWLSSGGFHVWNPGQNTPATEWEKRIDELMQKQIATSDQSERKRLFAEVQQIFGEHIPIVYFAAPRLVVAMTPRVVGAQAVPLKPMVLWSADTLSVNR